MQIGWTDPSTGERIDFEDALSTARDYGEWGGFPYEVLLGMYKNLSKVRPAEITVTTLLHCARKVHLEREVEYYADPHKNYPAFRGTIIHAVVQGDATPDAVVEERYARDFEGTRISGGIDWHRLMKAKNGKTLLRDYKSTNELPKYFSAYTSHRQQLNLYRWLLDLDPEETEMEVVYISMDGVKIIPLSAGGETRTGRKKANQVWDDDQVEEFLRERIALLKHEPILPYRLVPEEDLWMCAEYCEVRELCYRKAYQEQAKRLGRSDEPEGRVPPRERTKKK